MFLWQGLFVLLMRVARKILFDRFVVTWYYGKNLLSAEQVDILLI